MTKADSNIRVHSLPLALQFREAVSYGVETAMSSEGETMSEPLRETLETVMVVDFIYLIRNPSGSRERLETEISLKR